MCDNINKEISQIIEDQKTKSVCCRFKKEIGKDESEYEIETIKYKESIITSSSPKEIKEDDFYKYHHPVEYENDNIRLVFDRCMLVFNIQDKRNNICLSFHHPMYFSKDISDKISFDYSDKDDKEINMSPEEFIKIFEIGMNKNKII